MKEFLIHLTVFSGFFYLLYILVFRGLSFFHMNRWLLLSVPVICTGILWIAPHFSNSLPQSFGFSVILLPIDILPNNRIMSAEEGHNTYIILYFLGVLLSSVFFVTSLLRIRSIINSGQKSNRANIPFLFSKKTQSPFTYFNTIVLPEHLREDPRLHLILIHENTHRKQGHSYDNLYYNFLCILFWFIPFFHLLFKELRNIHEGIADRHVSTQTSRETYAQILLSSIFGSTITLPASPFFTSSSVKTRIIMLYKNKTPQWLRLSYLLILPVAVLLTLYACNKLQDKSIEPTVKGEAVLPEDVSRMPLFDGCNPEATVHNQQVCFNQRLAHYLSSELQYPASARAAGLEGTVHIRFIVDTEGKITAARVLKGIASTHAHAGSKRFEQVKGARDLEESALQLVKSLPRMQPAQKNGKAVNISLVLPISFQLS